MNEAETRPFRSDVPRFLRQLALRRRKRRFTGIELARRELQEHPMQRITELSLDNEAAIGENGDDEDCAWMNDVFANRRRAIG